MAPGTFASLEKTRKIIWTWNIPSRDASDMANLVVRLNLQRHGCCCNGYTACLEVNAEIRERVVCESPTWFQPIGGKGRLFSWREGGHDLEVWYNNVRVFTETAHLFVDGIEWESKEPFDKFWKSYAYGCFWWALPMLFFAGGFMVLGIMFLVPELVTFKLFYFFFIGFVICLILAFIQCFVGVVLLIRRPERMNAEKTPP